MSISSGDILISEPFISDPRFGRTVILLVEHAAHGSMGFVLNQKIEYTLDQLVEGLESIPAAAYQGGPVELDSFHYIHSYAHIDGAVPIAPELYWGGDFEQVKEGLASGTLLADDFKFFVGYSGWGSEQLAKELAENAWIVGKLKTIHILGTEINDTDLWKYAMRNTGGKNVLLANSPENPRLN